MDVVHIPAHDSDAVYDERLRSDLGDLEPSSQPSFFFSFFFERECIRNYVQRILRLRDDYTCRAAIPRKREPTSR